MRTSLPLAFAAPAIAMALVGGVLLGRATSRSEPHVGADVASSARTRDGPSVAGTPSPLAASPTASRAASTRVTIDLADWPEIGADVAQSGDDALWPWLLAAYAKAGRAHDAIAVARAALARGAVASGVEKAAAVGDASARLRLFEALRADGIDIPTEPGAWETLLVDAGRGADVLALGVGGIARVKSTAFGKAAALAVSSAFDLDAALAAASSEPWEAWRAKGMAEALRRAGKTTAASAWDVAAARLAETEDAREAKTRAEGLADQIAQAREVVAKSPDDADAWTTLGCALVEGRESGAVEALERALALDPASRRAAELLVNLAPKRVVELLADRWRTAGTDRQRLLLARAYLLSGEGKDAAETVFSCHDFDESWLLSGVATFAPLAALAAIDLRIAGRPLRSIPEEIVAARADALMATGRPLEAAELLARSIVYQFPRSLLSRWAEVAPAALVARYEEARKGADAPDETLRAWAADAMRRLGRLEEARATAHACHGVVSQWVLEYDDDEPAWIVFEGGEALAAADPVLLSALRAEVARHPHAAYCARRLALACALLGDVVGARAGLDRVIALDDDPFFLVQRLRLR